jgi:putative nucleotidyltransferase-like protein
MMDEVPEALTIVRRIAAFGLPGGTNSSEPVSLSTGTWRGVSPYLVDQRLTGLAVASSQSGWLQLADEQWEELLSLHRRAMMDCLRLERKLLDAAEAFVREGLQFVVLKGPALAHTLYPDPSSRVFGDLDLLVRTRDWRAAAAIVTGMGFRRQTPEPRAGFDERFGKAATHVDGDGLAIDLHRTLVLGPFGLWIDPDELIDRSIEFRIAGRTVRRLDDTGLLVNAVLHASLGTRPPLLLPLRDVAQVGWEGDVDWELLREWTMRWRLAAVVRHAMLAVESVLKVPRPPGADPAMLVPVARSERRSLESYTTPRRARGGTALATVRAIPRLRSKVAYVLTLLLPQRSFITARLGEGGPSAYLRRCAVPVRWMLRRSR